MSAETLIWKDAKVEPPDADSSVMIFNDSWDEPVNMGFLDGEVWRTHDLTPLDAEPGEHPDFFPPSHWAQMPEGPKS